MFLNLAKKAWHRLSVQLAFWYLSLFIFSSILIFSLTYFLLFASLKSSDHAFIKNRIEEYSDKFNKAGFKEMISEVRNETQLSDQELFFVRIADSANKTVFISDLSNWKGFDVSVLDGGETASSGKWILVPKENDEDVIEVYTSNLPDGHILQIGKGTDARNNFLEKFQNTFLAGIALAVLIALAGGLFLSFRLLAPIRHLSETVQSINQTGELGRRVPTRDSDDELASLVRLINLMLERIERLFKGMKDSLDNVAHDLRTPLTRIRGIAESALGGGDNVVAYREALSDCLEESDQVKTMLTTLMDISEAEAGTIRLNLAEVEMDQIINQVIDLYQPVIEDKKIHVSFEDSKPLKIHGDPVRLRQVFANLLDNALKFTPKKGSIKIISGTENEGIFVQMKDSGTGISESDMPKIWDRLYRGDKSRSLPGLGLGLSLIKAIVDAHQGKISVHSQAGQGALFTIWLPLNLKIAG